LNEIDDMDIMFYWELMAYKLKKADENEPGIDQLGI